MVEQPPVSSHKPFLIIIGTCLAIVVFAALGFIYLNKYRHAPSAAKTEKAQGKIAPVTVAVEQDVLRSRGLDVVPAEGGTLTSYAAGRIVMTLEIPPNALAKPTRIALVPLKNEDGTIGATVLPASVQFRQPVSLTFDIAHSSFRADAPAVVDYAHPRWFGKTQVVLYNAQKQATSPVLIARATETQTLVPARVLSGGTYIVRLSSEEQLPTAQQVFHESKTSALIVMEAATTILANKKTLAAPEQDRVKKVINKILGNKKAAGQEIFAATVLEKLLDNVPLSFLPGTVLAQGAEREYLEFRCKDRSLSIEEYLSTASTAQLIGLDDIGEACITAAKNRVAEEARKVLADSNASVATIIRMMGRCQMFGLDELNNALEKQLQATVKRRTDEVLKDPNATVEDVLRALQEAQAVGADESGLSERLDTLSRQQAQQTLQDPNASFDDVIRAQQEAQALGHEDIASQLEARAREMLNRSSQEILDNPNASSTELNSALAQAVKEGKDMAYRNEIRERIKEAEQREAEERKNEPTPAPGSGQVDEELLIGFDSNIIWLEMAKALGMPDCFSEECFKNLADELLEKGQEANAVGTDVCQEMPAIYAEVGMAIPPELQQECNKITSGEMMQEMENAHDKIYEESEQIDEIQSQDYEEEDFGESNMYIEITEAPEPDWEAAPETEDEASYSDEIEMSGDAGVEQGEDQTIDSSVSQDETEFESAEE